MINIFKFIFLAPYLLICGCVNYDGNIFDKKFSQKKIGDIIYLTGFISNRFEDHNIYTNRNNYKKSQGKYCIGWSASKKDIIDKITIFSEKYVKISGRLSRIAGNNVINLDSCSKHIIQIDNIVEL